MTLDTGERSVEISGRPVTLTQVEFEVLAALMEARGRVVTRDQLIDRLHPHGDGVGERSIDVYIGRLRAKLVDDRVHPRFVITTRGLGYRLGSG